MEAANVAATFAAVQQKLSPRHSNDGLLSSTPPDEIGQQLQKGPIGRLRAAGKGD
jgi:hypothetical protein